MTAHILRRVVLMVPLLLGLSILMFGLIKIAPGDPALFFLSSGPSAVAVDPDVRLKIRHELGLDRPIHVQYVRWLSNVVRGDLGFAITYQTPVSSLISRAIPATLKLQAAALSLAVLVAIPAGILSATRQYSLFDHGITTLSFLGLAVPNFWLALLLILLFSVNLGWLPSGGPGTAESALGRLPNMVMPTLVLAAEYLASYVRFTRASVLEVLRSDYVTTARAKGLADRQVLYRHVLKNALLPVATVVGLSLPRLVSGAIIVETIFAWPGVGRLAYDAILRRDQPVIMAITLIVSLTVIVSNLIIDIVYVLLDPRISYKPRA
jgi:peptide/nickel transport system permease protein